jgi:hypothetical protein
MPTMVPEEWTKVKGFMADATSHLGQARNRIGPKASLVAGSIDHLPISGAARNTSLQNPLGHRDEDNSVLRSCLRPRAARGPDEL